MVLKQKESSELEITKSFKAQKIVLYWLLGLIYFSFICLQAGRIQAIADFNYNLHEILYFPFAISVFVVPISFLVYIFLFIKFLQKRGERKAKLKNVIQSILIISSILIIIAITDYQFNEVSTGGVFKVEQKLHVESNYYLMVNDQKVKVSYNEFQLIDENQEYFINYIWNNRNPKLGELESIEPID